MPHRARRVYLEEIGRIEDEIACLIGMSEGVAELKEFVELVYQRGWMEDDYYRRLKDILRRQKVYFLTERKLLVEQRDAVVEE